MSWNEGGKYASRGNEEGLGAVRDIRGGDKGEIRIGEVGAVGKMRGNWGEVVREDEGRSERK